ncbi:MAG TPA: glycine cleavage system aminomethyltransferase GcvT [Hydrogenophaga sp.]|uniref:glycine cleavage system aminomethyltransferase GcvT n=1 Tax=Hydrogenophaga sp. TaxID=1904254 RepID=UPI002C7E0E83|nr:glycine cleavage system aminomethyltransferase GcvT [Hydrogenophaga sp.]HMN94335.1 glycine cleavage system aminomethyltransferase GcvT [Hydrogenophaga sp.]HMP09576.1 glycine cleavage system aminomethyltransferase GcvT [Hydrogenophaga sp.]
MSSLNDLQQTPLHALHLELGARMVPFAGYAMPVQYPMGVLQEHHHTRSSAGLFDVSHMGQLTLSGPEAAAAFESLMPVDVIGLGVNKQRYGLLLNDQGGIIDDLMFVNRGRPSAAGPSQGASDPTGGSDPHAEGERGGQEIFVIVNGACKHGDLAHIQARIGGCCTVTPQFDRALLALQGPLAVSALQRLLPGVEHLVFMTGMPASWNGADLYVTRSGYTGEDGFEISVPAADADAFARALLAQPEVKPIGLGARNSLRLEAGLCLYGNDIDTATTPVEAGLNWAMQKVRRTGGERAGGFPGADRVLAQLDGTEALNRKRVGLIALERVPVREHTELQSLEGETIGEVTSGLLGPSADRPVAMGYVKPEFAAVGSRIQALVRGKAVPMEVAPMPFVPNRYFRG